MNLVLGITGWSCALLLGVLVLAESGRAQRAERHASRQRAVRVRLTERLRLARRENQRLSNRVHDLQAQRRPIGPTRIVPQPPLAHAGDPDRTQILRREAS